MAKYSGKFIVSLDFELMWGVRDVATRETYGEHLRGVHKALPIILDYFTKYNISGTFATVGLLFFETKNEMLSSLPDQQPKYEDANLFPYGDYLAKQVGADSHLDRYHFAPELIQLIKNTPKQEIGTHTFSHFYCMEPGQTLPDFTQDIKAAVDIAHKRGVHITSIVFPRNQINNEYLDVCAGMGITNYRGNEDSWIYASRSGANENLLRRFVRLLDAYVNISGHHCYADEYMKQNNIINIPSSRFLRPYFARLRLLEGLRLRRIKKSMSYAAKNGLLYHLWWHPHNFGIDHDQNFSFMEKILKHYEDLNKKYDFTSYSMSGFAKVLSDQDVAD
ncbi:MAG: polysaccharide deacetylase family protein [Ferruginibacter sp.]